MLIVFSAPYKYQVSKYHCTREHSLDSQRIMRSILVITGMWYTVVRTTISISSAHAVHTFKNSQLVSISTHDYRTFFSGLLRCMRLFNLCGDKVLEQEWKWLYTNSWCNYIMSIAIVSTIDRWTENSQTALEQIGWCPLPGCSFCC